MSAAEPRPPVAVGRLEDLAPLEATVVCSLRLYYECDAGRDALARGLAAQAGPVRGGALMTRFGELCELTRRHARRPLLRRQSGCCMAGADETAFATMVAAAAFGEREDAMLIAVCLVRADIAPPLVALAEQVGLELARAARSTRGQPPTLH